MTSLPNTRTDGKRVPGKDKAKELRKRIDDSLDTLAKAVDDVRASDTFRAYVVCTHFGLDVEVRASRYIALWDGNSKALRASLERIASTARSLIDDVDAVAVKTGKAVSHAA